MKRSTLFILIFYFCMGMKDAQGDRTNLKIYENIQSDIFCFRRLNATHQIGCASHVGGDVGVLFILDNEEELQNATLDPPPMPFVAALPVPLYNVRNLRKLKGLRNTRGVVVFKSPTEEPPKSFSPDQACPNRNFGFYTEDENKEFAACRKKEWNNLPGNDALGMMYEDWGFPIFMVSNDSDIQSMRKCYGNFNNGSNKEWPLCSVQLKSVMLAAKDSETCMRRSKLITNLNQVKTCDPLSDKNIVNTLFPTNKSEEILNRSIIVVGARLDAFSMFDKLSPGAHSTVTGLVTLLAVSKNMADLRDNITRALDQKGQADSAKNILFVIFNGESFDYIGSSRIVFDMQQKMFPVPMLDSLVDQPASIGLHHISHFVELSQMAPQNNSLFIHTDPVSRRAKDVDKEVNALVDLLKSESKRSSSLKVQTAPDGLPLPPASFQSFLRKDSSIPGIVIADHSQEYINRYYNSIFDTNETVDMSVLRSALAEMSSAVTGMLYQLLTDQKLAAPVKTSEDLVSGLLECYLRNASCPLFRQIADPNPRMIERLREEPYPLYVSVDSGGHTKANAITLYTRYLLAYLTGSEETDRDRKNCTATESNNQIYHYDWMAGGPEVNGTGVCIKSTVTYTLAESPAFALNDWKSTEYSTWTESVWTETSVRIFLQPGKLQEGVTLALGFLVLFLSLGTVYFVNARASLIFNTKPLVSC